jgi:predicted ATPase
MTRFGQDVSVVTLSNRAVCLWLLGYPDAARADIERALYVAREFGHAATMMYALNFSVVVNTFRGDFAIASAQTDELLVLANEKGAAFWKATANMMKGWRATLGGTVTDTITDYGCAISAYRETGTTIFAPLNLAVLASAFAELRQFDDAWRCMDEAITAVERTGERWNEAEINRIAGEIALLGRKRDADKAESHFERALVIARAAGPLLRTPRRNEPRAPMARPRQAHASP